MSATVVGFSTTSSGQTHAFIWTQSGGMQDLTPGSSFAKAFDINISDNAVGLSDSQAFRWKSDTGIVLIDSGQGGQANEVNNNDEAIGSPVAGAGSRTVEWSASNVVINPYPTSNTQGIAINNLGQFVGAISTGFYSPGGLAQRQALPAGFIPTDINDNREIAGGLPRR